VAEIFFSTHFEKKEAIGSPLESVHAHKAQQRASLGCCSTELLHWIISLPFALGLAQRSVECQHQDHST